MTTLKITIDSKKNAHLLRRILQNMNFVEKVEEENSDFNNQYTSLKEYINSIEPDDLFQKIDDPVKWQKIIRDEIETSLKLFNPMV